MEPLIRCPVLACLSAAAGVHIMAAAASAQRSAVSLADSARKLEVRGDSTSRRMTPATAVDALRLYHDAAALYRTAGRNTELARTLSSVGRVHLGMSQPDSALASYQEALRISRQIGDRAGEGRALNGIGNVNSSLGRLDTALSYYHESLAAWRAAGDQGGQGPQLNNIGSVHGRLGRLDSALVYFQQALAIWRATGNKTYEGITLDNLGVLSRSLGRADSALAYHRRALTIHRETGNRAGEGGARQGIGIAYSHLGQFDSALVHYDIALSIFRETGDRAGEASTLNSTGNAHKNVGRPDTALVYLRRALAIHNETGDRAGAAQALNNIGVVFSDLGQPDSTLAYYHASLAIKRETGDRALEGATLENIGIVQRDLGRADSALAYHRQALIIHREISDRRGEGITLANMGVAYRDIGSLDSALAYFRQAFAIARETGNRVGEATVLTNIGIVQRELGRPDSALAYYSEALAIHRATGERTGEAGTLQSMGIAHRDVGQSDSALTYFDRALAIHRETRNRANEAFGLLEIGRVYLRGSPPAVRDPARASAFFDSASAVLATVRRSAGGDANAISFADLKDARHLYEAWALAWLARSREVGASVAARGALAAAERGRSQALLNLMRRRAQDATGAGVREHITQAGADLPAEADSLLAPVLARRSGAVSYLVTGDTLVTWIVTASGDVRLRRAALGSDTLAALVAALRASLGADAARGRMARSRGVAPFEQEARAGVAVGVRPRDAEQALRRLAALLLPSDIEEHLASASEIVIVPHGVLGLVPFSALPFGSRAEPLGSRVAIRYAPSFAALGALRHTAPVTLAAQLRSAAHALVVGNPAMPWVRNETGDSSRLRPLAAAGSEGRWVAERLGASALTGADASETTVRRRLPTASIIHLATHGLAFGTEARVRDSYIALAPDSTSDGLLTMGELLDDPTLTLSADLVVLSACQTGLGDLKHAEGTVGFQRALLARGARSVLVSLWSVDDAATRLLMQRFYTHSLEAGRTVSKAEALRRAQADVRKTKGYEHPRYWAAFQLVGAR